MKNKFLINLVQALLGWAVSVALLICGYGTVAYPQVVGKATSRGTEPDRYSSGSVGPCTSDQAGACPQAATAQTTRGNSHLQANLFPFFSDSGVGQQSAAVKRRSVEISGADVGIKCDGRTDDAPAINAALASVNYASGHDATTLRLPGPICAIRSTIHANIWSSVHLVGNGAGDFGMSGTKIKALAPFTGTYLLDLTSPGSNYVTTAFELSGIELDANKIASGCVLSRTLTSSRLDIRCDNPSRAIGPAVDIDVTNNGTNKYNSSVSNDIGMKVVDTPDGAATGQVTVGTATVPLANIAGAVKVGMHAYGQGMAVGATVAALSNHLATISPVPWYTQANASLTFTNSASPEVVIGRGAGIVHSTGDVNSNHFRSIIVQTPGPDAVVCGAADGNTFEFIEVLGNAGAGTTGPIPGSLVGLRLQGSTATSADPVPGGNLLVPDPVGGEACRYNIFYSLGIIGRVVVENGATVSGGFPSAVTGSIATSGGRTTLAVTAIAYGALSVGETVSDGKYIPPGTIIANQTSGRSGGLGTYTLRLPAGWAGLTVASEAHISAGPTNTYPAKNNWLHGMSYGDSFVYLDNANTGLTTASQAVGDKSTNSLNAISTDLMDLAALHSLGVGVTTPAGPPNFIGDLAEIAGNLRIGAGVSVLSYDMYRNGNGHLAFVGNQPNAAGYLFTTAGNGDVIFMGPGGVVATPKATFKGQVNQPLATPASSSAPCVAGDRQADARFMYVCVAANTWRRVALSGF